jgi:hypothetical protein
MKVELNPEELRLIVDALDDSCKAGEGGGVGKRSCQRRVTTLTFAIQGQSGTER